MNQKVNPVSQSVSSYTPEPINSPYRPKVETTGQSSFLIGQSNGLLDERALKLQKQRQYQEELRRQKEEKELEAKKKKLEEDEWNRKQEEKTKDQIEKERAQVDEERRKASEEKENGGVMVPKAGAKGGNGGVVEIKMPKQQQVVTNLASQPRQNDVANDLFGNPSEGRRARRRQQDSISIDDPSPSSVNNDLKPKTASREETTPQTTLPIISHQHEIDSNQTNQQPAKQSNISLDNNLLDNIKNDMLDKKVIDYLLTELLRLKQNEQYPNVHPHQQYLHPYHHSQQGGHPSNDSGYRQPTTSPQIVEQPPSTPKQTSAYNSYEDRPIRGSKEDKQPRRNSAIPSDEGEENTSPKAAVKRSKRVFKLPEKGANSEENSAGSPTMSDDSVDSGPKPRRTKKKGTPAAAPAPTQKLSKRVFTINSHDSKPISDVPHSDEEYHNLDSDHQ